MIWVHVPVSDNAVERACRIVMAKRHLPIFAMASTMIVQMKPLMELQIPVSVRLVMVMIPTAAKMALLAVWMVRWPVWMARRKH